MASSAAGVFNSRARGLMFTTHGETVTLTDGQTGTETTPTVIWRRASHLQRGLQGLGAIGYEGEAECTIRVADLPSGLGARSTVTRESEDWEILDVEPVDQWTSTLHLRRPDRADRMPGRESE